MAELESQPDESIEAAKLKRPLLQNSQPNGKSHKSMTVVWGNDDNVDDDNDDVETESDERFFEKTTSYDPASAKF